MRDTGGREQGASRAKPAEEGAGPPRRGLGTPINYLDFWGIALKYFQFRFTVFGYFLPRVKDSPARAIETSCGQGPDPRPLPQGAWGTRPLVLTAHHAHP